jgi:hypothetical protein
MSSKVRKCIHCGCTDDRACMLTGDEAGALFADANDRFPCSWISLVPPVCSAPACQAKHKVRRSA